jgi:RimJ/RimL family protein N-acetyltransferase
MTSWCWSRHDVPVNEVAPVNEGAVVLRPPTEADVDWITEACQDPEIQRWTRVPRPYTRGDAHSFVRNERQMLDPLVVVDAVSGEGLGASGLQSMDPATGEVESGYWVAPWARGRGVAAAAVRLMIERARTHGAKAVVLLISPGNAGSIAVAERAGFTLAERRSGGCFDGADATDTLVYRYELSSSA